MKQTKKIQSFLQLLLVLVAIVLLNVLGGFIPVEFDLTEDRRFTLNDATYRLIENLDEPVTIEILLEGEFPPNFQRVQSATKSLLDKFSSRSDKLSYFFRNPLDGEKEEIQEAHKVLAEKFGILPYNLTITSKGAKEVRKAFPAALIHYKNRTYPVNLLETPGGAFIGNPSMEVINNSINLLEYKFANALNKMQLKAKPKIVFLAGHGELSNRMTYSLEQSMKEFYTFTRLDISRVPKIDTAIDVVIIAKPRAALGEQALFKLDQYIMRGGKTIWLVDPLNIEDDSLRTNPVYAPYNYQHDFNNMLFNYGVRINANLTMDWMSTPIPMEVSRQNGKPQYGLRQWFYHVKAHTYTSPEEQLATEKTMIDHPIVKGIDKVNLFYPATVDTIKTQAKIKKTVLLRSSQYSKVQYPPVRVSIMNIKDSGLEQSHFQKGHQNLAVLLEGEFSSFFENRVSPEMRKGLASMGQKFLAKGKSSKMIVVGDGDIARNFAQAGGQPMALGFNPYDKYLYGNRDFLLNSIEYLIDNSGIIAARNKEIKLRPLDQDRAFEEEFTWQALNLILPLVLLALIGGIYMYLRRRRYA